MLLGKKDFRVARVAHQLIQFVPAMFRVVSAVCSLVLTGPVEIALRAMVGESMLLQILDGDLEASGELGLAIVVGFVGGLVRL